MPDTIISTVVKTLKAKPPSVRSSVGEMNGCEQLQNRKVGNTGFHSQSVTGAKGPEWPPQHRELRKFQGDDMDVELYFEGCRGVHCPSGSGRVRRRWWPFDLVTCSRSDQVALIIHSADGRISCLQIVLCTCVFISKKCIFIFSWKLRSTELH